MFVLTQLGSPTGRQLNTTIQSYNPPQNTKQEYTYEGFPESVQPFCLYISAWINHQQAYNYSINPHLANVENMVKVKVKCSLVQALRLCTGRTAHRGSRGIALLFLYHGTRRGEGSASRLGRSLLPGKIRHPLYRRLLGPQGLSWQVRKISPPPG